MEKYRVTDVGHRNQLTKRFARALASAAIVGTLALGAWSFANTSAVEAGGETRTISLYHVHTKESLTITYMQGGRYIPSAMKKINHLMRDWRRNEPITIDPRTLDLIWELHADLGSQRPIHIVCGYRSPRTNAFLKKVGRKVARKSQHMSGKAIDFYFPDVPTVKIRNSALARKLGGVGYYRSSGGPTGFLHADSGNVRYWGPGLSGSQMASAIREGRKYVGKRLNNKTTDMLPVTVAANEENAKAGNGGLWGLVTGKGGKKQQAPATAVAPLDAYAGADMAQISEEAAGEGDELESSANVLDQAIVDQPTLKKPTPVAPDTDGMASMAQTAAVEALADGEAVAAAKPETDAPTIGYILKPRLKPQTVVAMAGDSFNVVPANAPPESQSLRIKKPSPVAPAAVASLDEQIEAQADEVIEEVDTGVVSNIEGKTALGDMRSATVEEQPAYDTRFAAASFETVDTSWWNRLFSSAKQLEGKDGFAGNLKADLEDVMPKSAVLGPDGSGIVGYRPMQTAEGKGDLLVVNREGKGNLPPMSLRLSQAVSDPSATE